jgi:kinetochor protein Mis14/NSL1
VFAPFDARARARVEDLTREEEDLLRDIAALKKSVPGAAATAWADACRASVRADEDALAAAVERARADDDDAAAAAQNQQQQQQQRLTVSKLERQDEVESSYGRAVDGLARLKREMPAVVARMERARAAGSYAVTEK